MWHLHGPAPRRLVTVTNLRRFGHTRLLGRVASFIVVYGNNTKASGGSGTRNRPHSDKILPLCPEIDRTRG